MKGGDHMTPMTIRQARIMKEIPQSYMAKGLNICKDTYRKIERNPEKATIEQGIKIASLLNMDIDDLIFIAPDSTLSRIVKSA